MIQDASWMLARTTADVVQAVTVIIPLADEPAAETTRRIVNAIAGEYNLTATSQAGENCLVVRLSRGGSLR